MSTGWTVRKSIPTGSEVPRTRPDRPGGPPSPQYMGIKSLPREYIGRCMSLTTYPLPPLVSGLKKE